MQKEVLLLVAMLFAGGVNAAPVDAPGRGSSQLVMSTDPAFAELLVRYPDLEGANLVSVRNGTVETAAFRQIDSATLRRLAVSLLDEALGDPRATWAEDDAKARVFARPDTADVVVLQHRVDDRAVDGSFVVVRQLRDGSGSVTSSLAKVARTSAPALPAHKALAAARRKHAVSGDPDARIAPEPHYAVIDGVARLAYRVSTKAGARDWLVEIDASTGEELSRGSRLKHLDVAFDDEE